MSLFSIVRFVCHQARVQGRQHEKCRVPVVGSLGLMVLTGFLRMGAKPIERSHGQSYKACIRASAEPACAYSSAVRSPTEFAFRRR